MDSSSSSSSESAKVAIEELRKLPMVNLFGDENLDFSRELMFEALEIDCFPLWNYLSKCPLGLGLITAPAGSFLSGIGFWCDYILPGFQ